MSYKRLDAQSFAHALHTLLVLRGVGCALDYGYKEDLSDVGQVVARCRNLVLVLTGGCAAACRWAFLVFQYHWFYYSSILVSYLATVELGCLVACGHGARGSVAGTAIRGTHIVGAAELSLHKYFL